ncbi:hypothetical protein PFISCL1PPCAC_13065, partial [Pristionchus fissidentatus]
LALCSFLYPSRAIKGSWLRKFISSVLSSPTSPPCSDLFSSSSLSFSQRSLSSVTTRSGPSTAPSSGLPSSSEQLSSRPSPGRSGESNQR